VEAAAADVRRARAGRRARGRASVEAEESRSFARGRAAGAAADHGPAPQAGVARATSETPADDTAPDRDDTAPDRDDTAPDRHDTAFHRGASRQRVRREPSPVKPAFEAYL
jgi:hypothetical protein